MLSVYSGMARYDDGVNKYKKSVMLSGARLGFYNLDDISVNTGVLIKDSINDSQKSFYSVIGNKRFSLSELMLLDCFVNVERGISESKTVEHSLGLNYSFEDFFWFGLKYSIFDYNYDFADKNEVIQKYFLKSKIRQLSENFSVSLPAAFKLFGNVATVFTEDQSTANILELGLSRDFRNKYFSFAEFVFGNIFSYGGHHNYLELNTNSKLVPDKIEVENKIKVDFYNKINKIASNSKSVEVGLKGIFNNNFNARLLVAVESNSRFLYEFYGLVMLHYSYF